MLAWVGVNMYPHFHFLFDFALIYHRDIIIMIIIRLQRLAIGFFLFRLPNIPWHTNVKQILRK